MYAFIDLKQYSCITSSTKVRHRPLPDLAMPLNGHYPNVRVSNAVLDSAISRGARLASHQRHQQYILHAHDQCRSLLDHDTAARMLTPCSIACCGCDASKPRSALSQPRPLVRCQRVLRRHALDTLWWENYHAFTSSSNQAWCRCKSAQCSTCARGSSRGTSSHGSVCATCNEPPGSTGCPGRSNGGRIPPLDPRIPCERRSLPTLPAREGVLATCLDTRLCTVHPR